MSGRDGTGAQLFRYAILYGIAQKLKIPWRHRDIVYIDSNPGDRFENDADRFQFLSQLNTHLSALNKCNKKPLIKVLIRKSLSKRQFFMICKLLRIVKTPLNIFEISFYRPQTYLGYLSTDIFSAFQRDFYNQITQNVFNQDSIEIHAHIRGAINDPSRVTPPETLLKVLDKLLNILKAQNQPINLHLYTDIPRVDKVWQLNHANDGGTVLHWKTLGILDNDLRMSISGVDFENILSSRAAISTLSIQRNLDPIQMWQLTERAHIFVGCDSMVSFFMGLFNEKALSFFPSETSFPKKNNWFTFDRLGNLLELSRIRYNLKERGLL